MDTIPEDSQSLIELAECLTDLVEQMYIAHRLDDDERFKGYHKEAVEIGISLVELLRDLE